MVRDATAALEQAGVDTPALDAELLLAHALGVSRERLRAEPGAPVGSDAGERFGALLERRLAREPVAYILERKAFRWITLRVDRRVLIPRPETELLVEVALTLPSGARVLDVGTGSGAVALALAFERPDLEVWGSDISPAALAAASENGRRLGLPVRFAQADLLDGVPGRFDAVLANLPYVVDGAPLEPEIAGYEPPEALFAGLDGLEQIRRLVEQVEGVTLVVLEIDPDQAKPVVALLQDHGFRTEVHRDLAARQRVVVGRG